MFAVTERSRQYQALYGEESVYEEDVDDTLEPPMTEPPMTEPPMTDSTNDNSNSNSNNDAVVANTLAAEEPNESTPLAPPDLWGVLLEGLGNDYANIAHLPVWLDAGKVDSLDWR